MNALAPVGICTYTRLDKLRQTVDALRRNTLANQSELFVFSDGPRIGDEAKVEELRNYIHSIQGFKKVIPICQAENNLFRNTHYAHRRITEEHGRSIFMEDDVVTSPHYLAFMNDALNAFEKDGRVFSVGGYTPCGSFNMRMGKDVIFSRLFCSWGVGIWADRMRLLDDTDWPRFFSENHNDARLTNELGYIGKQTLSRFKRWCERGLKTENFYDVGDLLMTLTMLQNNMLTVLPRKSLVKNIGLDQSGRHTNNIDARRFETELDFTFCPKVISGIPTPTASLCREEYMLHSYSKRKRGLSRLFYLACRELKHLRFRLLK